MGLGLALNELVVGARCVGGADRDETNSVDGEGGQG